MGFRRRGIVHAERELAHAQPLSFGDFAQRTVFPCTLVPPLPARSTAHSPSGSQSRLQ